VALLVNTIATGAALVALILTFGPGAHFNPAVTLAVASQHGIASRHARSGIPQAFSEFVATFGLLAVIYLVVYRDDGDGHAPGSRDQLLTSRRILGDVLGGELDALRRNPSFAASHHCQVDDQ